MRNDWKDHWLREYRRALIVYKTGENEYDRGIAFGRCLALASTLTLEYGVCTLYIDNEVEADLLKKKGVK